MSFIDLGNIAEKEVMPGCKAKIVHSENMTLAYWAIEKGSSLPEHSHTNEQVATLIEGRFELTVDGNSRILEPGSVAIIPPNAKHSGRAITDCRVIDVFYPIREDYRK
ncbi:MAG: cupin domain-containing protein [Syntrophobacteraceae bacterium]|jgi:quercetin dioxygenase-like cupin family protein